ncbi:heat stress transcription factor A-4c isoform X1 [Capsicum annuum]
MHRKRADFLEDNGIFAKFQPVMDEGACSTNALPPFLTKTYEMVDDPSCDAIVSWSSSNKSFIVWNPPNFSRDLLPRYFKHNNFSSFIRQLNTYGFRKIDAEKWEFANEDNNFIRGQPHLLKNIHRRKPVHSHSAQNLHGLSSPLTESERQGYKEDIQKLKHENGSLHLDLQRHEQDHHGLELQLQVLTERVQHVEHRQKTMLSALARTLGNSVADLSHMPQLQVNDRKRRLPGNSCLYTESDLEDTRGFSSKALTRKNMDPSSLLTMNTERLDQLESSLTFWEDVLRNVDQAGIQQNCSLELDESRSCADSPAISYTQLDIDVGPKASGIDMNSEPNANPTPDASEPDDKAAAGTSTIVPTGVNDVFWEQFLTENPVSEVQSERKDIASKKNENKPVDSAKYWWNMKSVNSLAEQLGHLTPAEKT